MKIKEAGTIKYYFDAKRLEIADFHLDLEGTNAFEVGDILKCLINALRRELYQVEKKRLEIEMSRFVNPYKPDAADIKPIGWWAQ